MGRWLSRDPLGELGGIQVYAFVQNDPIDGLDPVGLIRWLQVGQGVVAIMGGVGLILLTPVLAPVAVVFVGVAGVTVVALGIASIVAGASERGPSNIPTGICGFTGYLSDRAWNPDMTPEEDGIGQKWSSYGDLAVGGGRFGLQWRHGMGFGGGVRNLFKD